MKFKMLLPSLPSLLALAAASTLLLSCGKPSDSPETAIDSQSNVVQSAVAVAGSEATASESGGSVGLLAQGFEDRGPTVDGSEPNQKVGTLATCNYSTSRSACSSNADTVTFNTCTADAGYLTLNGSWSETYSGTGAAACTVPVASGGSVTRTTPSFVVTLSRGLVAGATLTVDTNGGTTYSGQTLPATGITVSNTAGTRTIVINGTHKVLRGPRGSTWFDHYLTSTGLTVSGTRAAGTRTIGGTVTVYHQLAKYTAASTFSSVVWGSSTCCYPTSGTISTTFSGSIAGTSSMAFTATCGSANYTDTTGSTSAVTLNQCN